MAKTIPQKFCLLLALILLLTSCTPTATPAATQAPQITQSATTEPSSGSAGQKDHLRLMVLPYISSAPFFIAQDEGYFTDEGLDVEFVRVDITADAIPVLVQGQLDVVGGLIDAAVLNAIARESNVKYVADRGLIGAEGCSYTGFVARKDLLESGKLNDPKNLKGLKISTEKASMTEYILDQVLKSYGLTSADVELPLMPQPARLEALGKGAIDVAGMAEPWIYRVQKAGYGDLWKPWEKVVPGQNLSLIMYGPNLLVKNRDLGVRFMKAYLRALHQYAQGKTDRNVEIIAKYTQLKPEEVKNICWQPMREDGVINTQSVLNFQDWAIQRGYMKTRLTVEQFWDDSFVKEAAQALKQ